MVTIAETFWSHIAVGKPDECWPWIKSTVRGYGHFRQKRRDVYAHRRAYELTHQTTLTSDIVVCHSCDNPACCNPAHLWIGKQSDNLRDCRVKGRHRGPSPEKRATYNCKITPNDVVAIRQRHAAGEKPKSIAESYPLTLNGIHRIIRRETWKIVPEVEA